MKLSKFSTDNGEMGSIELPDQFSEPVRKDIIKKVVLALQSSQRQNYGAHPEAGKRAQAKVSRRRRDYRGSYGMGISRASRKVMSHKGRRFNWVGATSPGTVKGRQAHPPKASKLWDRKINYSENRKAIRSAMSATVIKELVAKRGHHIPKHYPFIVESSIESIAKSKDLAGILISLGFAEELARGAIKKIRAGRGKMRSRPYRKKKSLLIVVGSECPLIRAGNNIPGVDVIKVNELNVELLAPGAMPGRVTLWSENAIGRISKEGLFAQ